MSESHQHSAFPPESWCTAAGCLSAFLPALPKRVSRGCSVPYGERPPHPACATAQCWDSPEYPQTPGCVKGPASESTKNWSCTPQMGIALPNRNSPPAGERCSGAALSLNEQPSLRRLYNWFYGGDGDNARYFPQPGGCLLCAGTQSLGPISILFPLVSFVMIDHGPLFVCPLTNHAPPPFSLQACLTREVVPYPGENCHFGPHQLTCGCC